MAEVPVVMMGRVDMVRTFGGVLRMREEKERGGLGET